MINNILTILTCITLISCQSTKLGYYDNDGGENLFSIRHLQSNLEYLASDELEGREAATDAERVASKYIATELKKYGVQTLDGNDGYFQNFNLRHIHFSKESKFGMLNKKNELTEFSYGQDFVGSNRYYETIDTVTSIVFVGYGITAHEYQYDNYADLDVKGKIILFIPGEPESEDTTFFKGPKKTSFASSWSKIKNAKTQGALGAIYISALEEEYGWNSVVNYVEKGKLQFMEKPVRSGTSAFPILVIKESVLDSIFAKNNFSYEEINTSLKSKSAPAAIEFETKSQLFWAFDTSKTVQVRNVVGVLEGNDPDLNHEMVSIGCHFDHEGIGATGIYNGADDNASGTAAVMEIARVFAQTKDHKRSILLNFHTAEEKGLLGSKYFTANFDRMDDIVAHINLDMVGRGPTDSVYVIGSDKISVEYHDLVFSANDAGVGMHLDLKFNASNDPNRFYYRSDHYSFAKKNIPSVFFFDYMKEDYHKITDDADKINYYKLLNVTRLSYDIIRAAANREGRFDSDNLAGE